LCVFKGLVCIFVFLCYFRLLLFYVVSYFCWVWFFSIKPRDCLEQHLRNDLFCVAWDVKPCSIPFYSKQVLAASALQPLKSEALSLHLSIPVPVLVPSVITSRPTTASRPSNPLNPLLLRLRFGFCWPLCTFINYIY